MSLVPTVPAHTDGSRCRTDVQTVNRILTSLLYVSPKRGLLYVTNTYQSATTPVPTHRFEHLSCFLPGLLALGAHTLPDSAFANARPLPLNNARPTLLDEVELRWHDWRTLHRLAAEGLAETCYQLYADQPSGLGPNEVVFQGGGELWLHKVRRWRMDGKVGLAPGLGARKVHDDADNDYSLRDARYLLRPEVGRALCLFAVASLICSADGRVDLHHVEDDGERHLARARVEGLPGAGEVGACGDRIRVAGVGDLCAHHLHRRDAEVRLLFAIDAR